MAAESDSHARESLADIAEDTQSILRRSGEEIMGDNRLSAMMEKLQELQEKEGGQGGVGVDVASSEQLASVVKEMASALKYYENCGSSDEEEADFVSGMAQRIAGFNNPHGPTPIQEGTIAMIHSLESAAGKRMNGSRTLPIRYRPEQARWEVRVEFEEGDATKALKEANLTTLRRLSLPTGPHRGFANINDMENMPQKLCELLVYHKEDFSPSEIIYSGYGSMAFQRMGQSNFMCFNCIQMEQMGGVLGLGNLCREAEEPGTEAVVFALLEGNEMYIDVLIQTMHWTGEIIEEDNSGEIYMGRRGFSNTPPSQLTPDQDDAPYIRTMKEGPLLILECVAKYSFAPALWAALSNSEFFHLLIQRLLRWVAREVKRTCDGTGLGRKARMILSSMFPEARDTLKQPISGEAADKILSESSTLLGEPSSVTIVNLNCLLLNEGTITI